MRFRSVISSERPNVPTITPSGVAKRQLGGEHPSLTSIGPDFLLLFGYNRYALVYERLLIVAGLLCTFRGNKLEIGSANDLRRIAAPENLGVRPVALNEAPFAILEVDGVRQLVQQGVQAVPFLFQQDLIVCGSAVTS